MATRELSDALLRELAAALEPRGYARREQSFWRETGPCRLAFHVAFIRHHADVDVTADVAVRHHSVENLLNADRSDLSARERMRTATVGAQLGHLAGIGQQRWSLARPEDVAAAAQEILAWFERLGEPWLTRFASLEEVGRVLQDAGPESWLICPISERRAAILSAIGRLGLKHGRPAPEEFKSAVRDRPSNCTS